MKPTLVNRRGLVVLAAMTLATAGTLVAERSPTLFVFVPSLVRSRALVELLEDAMPGVEVVAFGRFADFMSAVGSLKPSAALSLADALSALGLKAQLAGVGPGGRDEPYALLTHRGDVTLSNLGSRCIGIVDVVGRRALPELVRRLLALSGPPQVVRVLKVSDLVPLLSLGLADAVVVPERMVEPLVSSSRLKLRVLRPPTAKLRRVALSFAPGAPVSSIQAGVTRLSHAALEALGISGWETVQ
jgi:hypothetical protein